MNMNENQLKPVTNLSANDISSGKDILNAIQEAKSYADLASNKLLFFFGSQGEILCNELSVVFQELERIEMVLLETYPQIDTDALIACVIALDIDGFVEYRVDQGDGKRTYTNDLSLATHYRKAETPHLFDCEKLVFLVNRNGVWCRQD